MFAIYHRDVVGSGKGQVIDVSIWEGLYSMLGPNATRFDLTGAAPKRIGNRSHGSAPRNCYRTKDNRWVAIAGSTQTTAARLFDTMGQPELIRDPRFNSNENRIKNVEVLDGIVGKWMQEHPLEEIMQRLNEKEVPVGPVFDIQDIIQDAHAQAREMVIKAPDEDRGTILMEGIFPKMSLTPGDVRHSGKALGADNKEIFEERLGLSRKETEELRKEKIL
jgi:crotonobetainyl-CoA:carnitine CoA-transferase CaiB-like acyl-CoA transferase